MRTLKERGFADSEERIRAIIEHEPECVKVVGADGRLLEMNPAGLAMLEAGSLAEVQARPLLDYIVPEHRKAFADLHKRVMRGESGTLEFEVRGLKGGRRWLETHAGPLRGADGRVAMLLGITRDVTERRAAEEALRESEERYRAVVGAMAEGVVVQEASGAIVSANGAAERILGLTRDQLVGRTSLDPRWRSVHEDGSPFPGEAHPAIAALRSGEPQANVIMGIYKPAGTLTWLSINSRPLLRPGEARPYAVVTTFHDVTERRAAEAALRDEQERLQLLMDNVPAMIAYADAKLRMRYANVRYRVFYGGSEAALEGRALPDLLTPDTWQRARPGVERALQGETVHQSGERTLHDGSRRHVSVSLVPDRGATGAVRGLYILALDVTAQHEAEKALRESEAAMRHAQHMARIGHVVVRADGSYERWSDGWPLLLGLAADTLPRSTRETLEYVHPDDRGGYRALAIDAAKNPRVVVIDYRIRQGDGTVIHVHQTMEPLGEAAADGRRQWFVTVQDVTQQKLAEERIRRLNRVYAVLSGINGAIVRIREREELFGAACRIAIDAGGFRFAWICVLDAAREQLVPAASAGQGGDFLERIQKRLSLRDGSPAGHGAAAIAVRENRAVFVNDVAADPLIADKDLHLQRGILSVAVLPIAVGGRVVAALGLHAGEAGFFDAQEQGLLVELAGDIAFALDHIDKDERVRYLAYFDPLTGLANRALLLDRLSQLVSAAQREGRQAALVVINIDRFKAINDAHGRPAGDAVLKEVAARLVRVTGEAGNVARVGPDQFAVLVPVVRREESLVRSLEEGNRVVDGAPYRIDGAELRVSTRAGVAVYPHDGADAEALFRNAEAALKNAASGERYLFYTAKMTERVAERLELENKMHLALERGEFVLHYQPKFALDTRHLTGAEALIRWQSSERGLVPPAEFIPVLEATGLIGAVGQWALRQAALDRSRWLAEGLLAPRVAVNVSPVQLRRADFVPALNALIAETPAAQGLDLEITESVVMEDIEANIAKLRAIRELGPGIAVDDFGTGYSSLAYLARLPVAALKVDRSFIRGMVDDPDSMALVASIISLAHSLRLVVVAEGVETDTQASYLRVMRCDEVQGFLFGRPVPAADFRKLLAT